jgi:hypothetical protein
VVYITDDPYFRAFWKSGRILLGNVVLDENISFPKSVLIV